ncbi:MAG: tRNA lysidine(34) synthetase TilS [Deltaproteobacteria bacterium]|nr:tRNA lysidine(34) synthetase TilS [Deltaproteobacteria bacterium]
MERRFLHSVKQQRLFLGGETVLTALSGGPDSVALLGLLRAVAGAFGLRLRAAHLDHGIRSEAAKDREFVEELCGLWGVPLDVERIDVPRMARQRRQGIEEAARDLRRSYLLRVADEKGCDLIALGHHLDDQAETVLHRLLRGSGPTGLAAMRPRSGRFIRPLLPFSRWQILDYLQKKSIVFVEDVSNRDCRYTRNRIRHQLLPLLREFNPVIEEQLGRLAEFFAADEDYWGGEIDRLSPQVGASVAGGWSIHLPRLRELPVAVQRRLLRGFLERLRGTRPGLSWRQFQALEKILDSSTPHAEVALPGCWGGRDYDRLWLFEKRPDFPEPFSLPLHGPGELLLPGAGRLAASLTEDCRGEDRWSVEFDADLLPFPLTVRSYRDGDRFQPEGGKGRKKIKELFIDLKIPFHQRRRVPLVATGEILWVAGLRRSALYPVGPKTSRVLRLTFAPGELWPNLSL